MSEKQEQVEATKTETIENQEVVEKTTFPSLEEISTTVADAVTSKLVDPLTGIGKAMETMGNGITSLTEVVSKMAEGATTETETETETKTETETETETEAVTETVTTPEATTEQPAGESKEEVAKSVSFADLMGVLNKVAERLNSQQDQLDQVSEQVVEVSKSASAMGQQIPNSGITRDESVRRQQVKEDKNACLDSAFAFLK